MKTRLFFIAALVVSTSSAFAQASASGPCKNLLPDECAVFQRYKQQEAAKKEAQQLQYQRGRQEEEELQKAKKEASEKQQAQWAEARTKQRAEQEAREAAFAKQREAEDRAQEAADRRAAAAASGVKAKCGEDYKAPRIGMSIERVKSCVTTVKLTGQLNRADGVVSTYEGGNAYFHVMEGRLISWGKY